jgi:hypothetical protein
MTTQEWITLSVKVTQEQKNVIEKICQHEGISINKFISKIINKEIEPILNPAVLPENKGLPTIGENKFKYVPEKDSFIWQLDLGVNGSAVLSEELSPFYLENLKKAIDEGIKQRHDFYKKAKKGIVIPSKIMKYEVNRNASI